MNTAARYHLPLRPLSFLLLCGLAACASWASGTDRESGTPADSTTEMARNQPTGPSAQQPAGAATSREPEQLLLKDCRPRSIYKIPQTKLTRARFPVIDMHAHDHGKSHAELAQWVQTMDELNIQRAQDRLVYGTDMGRDKQMYLTTFRILETEDEHFYDWDLFSYHWPLHGLALPDDVLRESIL